MRQRSRAYIVAEESAPNKRIVFINSGEFHSEDLLEHFALARRTKFDWIGAFPILEISEPRLTNDLPEIDIAMGDTGVRRSIVQQLSSQFPGLYNNENIAFVGTHSHAGVGGYLENLLPQVTSLGYVKQTADAIISGTVRAVQRAHANLAPGRLSVGNTTILDGNINRSPTAYLANPAAERARYPYDTDKDMSLLRFDDANGNPRGFLSFYPVHGTSLYNVRSSSPPCVDITSHDSL